MSWQDYVDKQLLASRCVTKAAIAGHDGNIWAKSEGFDVSVPLLLVFGEMLPAAGPFHHLRSIESATGEFMRSCVMETRAWLI